MIKILRISFLFIILIFCASKGNTAIKDGLFATVGDKAITFSDIENEVKLILILSNTKF